MAKKCSIERNNKRIKMAAFYEPIRKELRVKALNPKLSPEERYAARVKLQSLPRNGSLTRVKRRCQVTGRSRGVYAKLMLSRITLREFVHKGFIPGMKKASW